LAICNGNNGNAQQEPFGEIMVKLPLALAMRDLLIHAMGREPLYDMSGFSAVDFT